MSRDRTIKLGSIPTSTPGTEIDLSVSYDEGGPNYFHGTINPRGFNFYATVWRNENGHRTTLLGTGGLKHQVETATRYNAKRLAKIAEEAKTPGSDLARRLDELVAGVMRHAKLAPAPALTQLGATA